MMGFGDLLSMFGGSGGMGSMNMPVNVGQMAPRVAPDIQTANFSAMPQMANPNQSPFSMIGNALMQGSQGQNQQMQPLTEAYAPQQAPVDMGLLQQLLASIGQGRR